MGFRSITTPRLNLWPSVAGALLPLALVAWPLSPAGLSAEKDASTQTDGLDAETQAFVKDKVRPLLEARCFKCHGPEGRREKKKLAGGLLLTSRENVLKGGETGPAVVPNKPQESLLIEAINWNDQEMPPDSKLPAGEIAILTRWVKLGAPLPAAGPATTVVKEKFPLAERRGSHWSWRPVTPPAQPPVKNKAWPTASHDYFILEQLEKKSFAPAPPADRRTLIRRAYFDVIGLPPTPQQVAAFVNDPAPTAAAFGRVVDELLDSPHFGERWGRHWLDLMRYAESRGHEFDHTAANAYQYRDYVIRALNADVPYDQFVIEHLAGDLLAEPRLHPEKKFNESVLGTGFWYLGDWVHSPVDIRRDETDRVDNMIDTLSRSFLGLTVACARCHDHKFDPITAADYYALAGYAQSSQYRQVRFETMHHNGQIADQLASVRNSKNAEIRGALGAALAPGIKQSASYLSAAREVIAGGDVAKVAAAHKLDAKRLAAWQAKLTAARSAANDPLHLWALVAHDAKADVAGITKAQTDRWTTEAAKLDEQKTAARIVVDYANIGAGFFQDGYSFGSGPVRPGDLRLSADAVGGVFTYGAARRDPLWHGLNLAGGTEGEAGAINKLGRPGKTLRTPTFTIKSGSVHYLVRGAGHVQAVVGSHRLIAGPLHGNLVRSFDTKGNLQWIGHGLDRYKGQRAHLEIAPAGNSDLEVLMVADTRSAPPITVADGPHRTLLAAVSAGQISKPAQLDEALVKVLDNVRQRLADGAIADAPGALDDARLADWLLTQRDLFVAADSPEMAKVRELATGLAAAEKQLASQIQKTSRTAIATWEGSGEDENLLIRGSSSNPGPLVPRRFLEALGGKQSQKPSSGSGRLDVAREFVNAENNPFISRVFVNRVWHHLFGRGIVPSVDNFGVLGQPPSHPKLLDHLAHQFVQDGWSTKRFIRSLILSSTYQMSSKPVDQRAETEDPENILLHRMRVRRLQGEIIRDTILAVSGRLDPKLEGPSVRVYLTAFMTGRGRPGGGPLDGAGRRSIYTNIRRNFLPPMMLAFDMPIPFNPVGRRNVSNVPAQPLILMNDPFVVEQTKIWAQKILTDTALTPEQRIDLMYQTAFGRPPTETETADGLAFLKDHATLLGVGEENWKTEPRVWADYAHVLWNVKEFIFID